MMNPLCHGSSGTRKKSNFDGLLSQIYSPCIEMPDALQKVLDQLAAHELGIIAAASALNIGEPSTA